MSAQNTIQNTIQVASQYNTMKGKDTSTYASNFIRDYFRRQMKINSRSAVKARAYNMDYAMLRHLQANPNFTIESLGSDRNAYTSMRRLYDAVSGGFDRPEGELSRLVLSIYQRLPSTPVVGRGVRIPLAFTVPYGRSESERIVHPRLSSDTVKCVVSGLYFKDSEVESVITRIGDPSGDDTRRGYAALGDPEVALQLIKTPSGTEWWEGVWVLKSVWESVKHTFDPALREWANRRGVCHYGFASDYLREILNQSPRIEHPNMELTLGIELELEPKGPYSSRQDRVDRANALVDLVRRATGNPWAASVERDGSLSDNGFELVTGWTNLSTHNIIWNKVFGARVKGHSIDPFHGLKTTSACGTHVHVGRATGRIRDSEWTVVRRIIAHLLSNEDNRSVITRIGGRDFNSYCAPFSQWELQEGLINRRHRVVNIQGETIEFRIFKGTTSRTELFRFLEFAHSMTEFAVTQIHGGLKHHSDSGWTLYLAYLARNHKDYPVLASFLGEELSGYISALNEAQAESEETV